MIGRGTHQWACPIHGGTVLPARHLTAAAAIVILTSIIGGCNSSDYQAAAVTDEHSPDHFAGRNGDPVHTTPAGELPHAHPHDHDHPHTHSDSGSSNHALHHPSYDASAPCTCAEALNINGWCRSCNAGYVAGVRIESPQFFESIDPHGHPIDRNQFTCESCRSATASDGYCDTCRMGSVRGMTYFTRLTHGLAQGTAVTAGGLSCSVCASHLNGTGWCSACSRGIVGNVLLRDKAVFESTAQEYRTLQTAMTRLSSCEACAAAMMLHSTCPFCLISYERSSAVTSSF